MMDKPKPDDDDKKKQAFLKTVPGVVARRRGEVNKTIDGKVERVPVYLIDFYPWGPKDKMVMYEKPYGVKEARGKGSVQKSATLLRGIPPKDPIVSNTGAVDDVITVSGKKVKVTSVRDKDIKSAKFKMPKPKPFKIPQMVDNGDGIVYNKRTGRGHLKIRG